MITLYLQTAATHTNNTDKNFTALIWISPPVGTGTIRFRCSNKTINLSRDNNES